MTDEKPEMREWVAEARLVCYARIWTHAINAQEAKWTMAEGFFDWDITDVELDILLSEPKLR